MEVINIRPEARADLDRHLDLMADAYYEANLEHLVETGKRPLAERRARVLFMLLIRGMERLADAPEAYEACLAEMFKKALYTLGTQERLDDALLATMAPPSGRIH